MADGEEWITFRNPAPGRKHVAVLFFDVDEKEARELTDVSSYMPSEKIKSPIQLILQRLFKTKSTQAIYTLEDGRFAQWEKSPASVRLPASRSAE